jgi:hypothetical protein
MSYCGINVVALEKMRLLAITLSIVVTAASFPQIANAAESRFTSIANKDCRFAPIGNEPGDEEDQLKICPGLGGAQVLVNSLGTRLRIGMRWPRSSHPNNIVWITEAWSAGFVMDWRGSAGDKDFVPYAAIIRMKFQKQDTPAAGEQVLAVIRVTRATACVMGAVDVGANRNANELAHALADTTPSFVCGRDKPAIGGTATAAAREIIKGYVE